MKHKQIVYTSYPRIETIKNKAIYTHNSIYSIYTYINVNVCIYTCIQVYDMSLYDMILNSLMKTESFNNLYRELFKNRFKY